MMSGNAFSIASSRIFHILLTSHRCKTRLFVVPRLCVDWEPLDMAVWPFSICRQHAAIVRKLSYFHQHFRHLLLAALISLRRERRACCILQNCMAV